MDIKKSHTVSLDILFFIITVFFHFALVQGASVAAPNQSGILNEGLNLTCTYTLETGESFDSLTWARKRNSDENFIDIAKFGTTGDPIYYQDAGEIRNRSSLLRVNNGGYINIRTLICVDEAEFRCTVLYTRDLTLRNEQSTMTVTLQGRPEKPSSLIPSGENAEYDIMTFDCTSVVGKEPLGTIKWEGIRGSTSPQDLSADSVVTEKVVTPGSCTRTFTSRLTRNVTRNDKGLVIRCRTTHAVYQDPEHYLDLSPLVVNYPVDAASLSVSQDPNVPTHDVGKRVRLICQIAVVPAATYKWRHLKSNQTYDQGTIGLLELVNAQVDQSGTYECEATNSYQNMTYTATQTIDIDIQIPTTSSATSPEVTSPSNTGGGNGNTDKSTTTPEDDNTVLIIIICVVIAVVVLVVIIIVVIFKKKRNTNKQQRIEEPPEKAYNNNPAINTYANQPDIVGDDKKKNYQNSFSSSPYNSNPYSSTNYPAHNNSFSMKSDDLSYGEMNFDDRPRSRKPVALSDADYADISMPHV